MQREGQRSRQAPKPVQHLGRLAPKDKAPQASPGEQAVLPGPRDGLIPRGVFLSGTVPPAPQRQSQLLPGEGPVREKPAVSPALHQSPAGAPVRRLPVIGAGAYIREKAPPPGEAPRPAFPGSMGRQGPNRVTATPKNQPRRQQRTMASRKGLSPMSVKDAPWLEAGDSPLFTVSLLSGIFPICLGYYISKEK